MRTNKTPLDSANQLHVQRLSSIDCSDSSDDLFIFKDVKVKVFSYLIRSGLGGPGDGHQRARSLCPERRRPRPASIVLTSTVGCSQPLDNGRDTAS